jgi:hypothetical protein
MAPEFLGIHLGTKQLANLDGNGEHEQIRVMRYDYGDPLVGTGRESLAGGNHLRYWCHSTGAYFLAVSAEEDVGQKHTIIPDGYNVGRDQFVGTLVGKDVATRSVKAGDTFEVETSWNGWTYRTDAEYVAGLLDATSEGINHADTVGVDGKPSVDGLVAVLTVSITQKEIF